MPERGARLRLVLGPTCGLRKRRKASAPEKLATSKGVSSVSMQKPPAISFKPFRTSLMEGSTIWLVRERAKQFMATDPVATAQTAAERRWPLLAILEAPIDTLPPEEKQRRLAFDSLMERLQIPIEEPLSPEAENASAPNATGEAEDASVPEATGEAEDASVPEAQAPVVPAVGSSEECKCSFTWVRSRVVLNQALEARGDDPKSVRISAKRPGGNGTQDDQNREQDNLVVAWADRPTYFLRERSVITVTFRTPEIRAHKCDDPGQWLVVNGWVLQPDTT